MRSKEGGSCRHQIGQVKYRRRILVDGGGGTGGPDDNGSNGRTGATHPPTANEPPLWSPRTRNHQRRAPPRLCRGRSRRLIPPASIFVSSSLAFLPNSKEHRAIEWHRVERPNQKGRLVRLEESVEVSDEAQHLDARQGREFFSSSYTLRPAAPLCRRKLTFLKGHDGSGVVRVHQRLPLLWVTEVATIKLVGMSSVTRCAVSTAPAAPTSTAPQGHDLDAVRVLGRPPREPSRQSSAS